MAVVVHPPALVVVRTPKTLVANPTASNQSNFPPPHSVGSSTSFPFPDQCPVEMTCSSPRTSSSAPFVRARPQTGSLVVVTVPLYHPHYQSLKESSSYRCTSSHTCCPSCSHPCWIPYQRNPINSWSCTSLRCHVESLSRSNARQTRCFPLPDKTVQLQLEPKPHKGLSQAQVLVHGYSWKTLRTSKKNEPLEST